MDESVTEIYANGSQLIGGTPFHPHHSIVEKMNSKTRFNLGIGDRSFEYRRTIVWVQANDGKVAVSSLILYGFTP